MGYNTRTYRMTLATGLTTVALLLGIVGCGDADDEEVGGVASPVQEETPVTTASPTSTSSPVAAASPTKGQETMPDGSPSTANVPQPVRLAIQQAAEDAGVAEAEVELVEYEAVEWRDTALGCPEPGMMYAQVIVPGYRVLLNVEGETLEYHTDLDGTVVQCDGEE